VKNELIQKYQETIVEILIASLKSFNRRVGKEIFISMLKGKKDSKIVKGKYYNNEYYGIFSIFSRDDLSNIISGDGDY